MSIIKIGTRDSTLALIQTKLVIDAVKRALSQTGNIQFEVVASKAIGDLQLGVPLSTLGVKTGQYGVFVKELEQALLSHEVDLAIHSLKDMPSVLPEGLVVHPVLARESVADVLISNDNLSFWALPAGAVVGTSSLRRTAQLKCLRSDITVVSIRGNVQTRLRKLQEERIVDALVLAEAGVNRLGLQALVSYRFDALTELLPAPCQGVLGVESRGNDKLVSPVLSCLANNAALERVVFAERTVMRLLEGGCQLPLGVYACWNEPLMALDVRVQLLSPVDVGLVVAGMISLPADQDNQAWLASLRPFCNHLLASGGEKIKQQVSRLYPLTD
jgi:hydroxymethylbilane synthase